MKLKIAVLGLLGGLVNGLLGTGGGLIIVPLLKSAGLESKQSHATSLFIILPMTLFSACLYIQQGRVSVQDIYPYILPSLAGALLGAIILKKIRTALLNRIFGLIMIYAGLRIIFA